MVRAAEGGAQASAVLLATTPRHVAEAAEPSELPAEHVAQGPAPGTGPAELVERRTQARELLLDVVQILLSGLAEGNPHGVATEDLLILP